MTSGRLVAIYTSEEAAGSMRARDEVRAVSGKGLDGDRYAFGAGTYSERGGPGREVTLVAREDVAAANGDGVVVGEHETRRNLVTEGIELLGLVGRTFRIGEVVLRGVRSCPPCDHLEGLTRRGVRTALEHRGGLRADVVDGGTLRVGDPISVLDTVSQA